jgi:hypothetical protein
MSVIWTDAMNSRLLAARTGARPLGWKRLVLEWPGVSVEDARRQLRLLSGGSPEEERGPRRDGLLWLVEKRRLTKDRYRQALRYRAAFRDGGSVSLKSSADIGAGGGAPGPRDHLGGAMVSHTQAQRDLFVMRWEVLKGQGDMLIVMDAVCGVGHSLRELTGGDWKRAGELEAALRVALDLLHADEFGVDVQKAA